MSNATDLRGPRDLHCRAYESVTFGIAVFLAVVVFGVNTCPFIPDAFAADALVPGKVPRPIPDHFLNAAEHFDRFLKDNPAYRLGSLEKTSLTPEELKKVYEQLGHANTDCQISQDFKRADQDHLRQQTDPNYSRLARSQMKELVQNLRNPANYVEGHYAGRFSGYAAGDRWGLKLVNTPGAPIPSLRLCVYGWMRPGETTKFVGASPYKPPR